MKVTEAIAAEHALFINLFDQIERVLPGVRSPAQVGTIAAVVAGLLGEHAQLENDFAFVALDQAPLPKDRLETMRREHHELDDRLLKARRARTCTEARRLLRAAMHASIRHFRNEERYVFPVLDRVLKPQDLATLGRAFEKSRWGGVKPHEQRALGVSSTWPLEQGFKNAPKAKTKAAHSAGMGLWPDAGLLPQTGTILAKPATRFRQRTNRSAG